MGGAVKAITSVVSTALAGPLGSYAGMALTGFSMLQKRRQAKKAAKASRAAADEQRRQEQAKARFSEVQAQRQRVEQQRQARIRQGQITASMGSSGMGLGGTSSYSGAMGSVATQESKNISDINMGVGFGQAVSQSNQAIGRQQSKMIEAQASAQGWQQMTNLGGSMMNMGNFGNIFGQQNKEIK